VGRCGEGIKELGFRHAGFEVAIRHPSRNAEKATETEQSSKMKSSAAVFKWHLTLRDEII
jgi:hypothetical protein